MTPDDVARFERSLSDGGVGLFPADTVYGLAVHAESLQAVERLYQLKERHADRPAAVMFCRLEPALAALPELPPRTLGAVERLLPGAVTLLLPNPGRLFPLACGPAPAVLGLRVPELAGALAPLSAVSLPLLQSSANPSGGRDARRLAAVDPGIRAGVDVALDGGELPGTPSTVVDLTRYEEDGEFTLAREGALPRDRIEAVLYGGSR